MLRLLILKDVVSLKFSQANRASRLVHDCFFSCQQQSKDLKTLITLDFFYRSDYLHATPFRAC